MSSLHAASHTNASPQPPPTLRPWASSITSASDDARTGPIRRIRQACAYCRHRKTKCSGEKPRCRNCQRAKRTCLYEPYSHSSQNPATANNGPAASPMRGLQLSSLDPGNVELLKRIKHIESQLAVLSDQTLQEIEVSSPTDSLEHESNFFAQPQNAVTSQSRSRRPSQTVPRKRKSVTPDEDSDFSTLPPNAVVQSLINCYFENVHCQPYSYFQEESFRDNLACGRLPKCLIFAVLASALRFSNHSYFSRSKQEATEAYARTAWLSVLDDHMTAENSPNLHVAQTTNLLAIIDFTAGRISSAWLKIGLAVRIVQDLHLMHEPSSTLTPVEQEERRRVLWSVYLLDKLVACGRSRPPALTDEDCLVQLPSDEETFRRGLWKQTSALHQTASWTSDEALPGGNFTLTILAASALGRCARYMLHDPVGHEKPPWDSRSDFASINTYLLLLTTHLRVEDTSADDILNMYEKLDRLDRVERYEIGYLLFSRTIFHLCYCLLNHPLLLRLRLQKLNYKHKAPGSFLTRSFETSLEHASSLLDLLGKATSAKIPLRASFYAYATTLAGSITTIAIQAERPTKLLTIQDLQERNRQSLVTLEGLGHSWRHASKMHTQLLLFDSSMVSNMINHDGNAQTGVDPESEEILWLIVDYGLMCSRSGKEAAPTRRITEPPPYVATEGFSGMDFSLDVDLVDGIGSFCTGFDDQVEPNFALTNIECGL